MRKVVIFTMILTLIFATAGCTDHSEPDKKTDESSSTNAIIDTTQMENLSEKTENETVEKSTFAEETTEPTIVETGTEKVSKEPTFSQTTTANNEPKQDTQRKKRPKAKTLSLKSQQILFWKSQQQLNKLKNLIYRIGFLTLRIVLKVLVLHSMKPQQNVGTIQYPLMQVIRISALILKVD